MPDEKLSGKRPGFRLDAGWLLQHEDKVLVMLTLLIGAVVGLVIVAFIVLTENLGARMYPAGGAAWRRLLVPVAGSLLTGFLLFRYFPGARGSGIPQTKVALFLHNGVIALRTVLGKFWCSSLSLASGIALGREGPSVQLGAGIASVLGRQFGLSPEKAKALVPIGASAALAAAFNTPIAAVLFTLEEVLGDLHARVLGAIVLSSATSWMVLHLLLGDEPLFHVPQYQLVHPVEFLFYAVLGALGGLVSAAFVKMLLRLRLYFMRLPSWTAWLQPVAGGLMVGILGWFVPAVLGVGYAHVGEALNSRMALGTMALLVGLKLIATATCYASGNAGGIFGPSLFIGAMMGGALGAGAHLILPDYTGSVGAYALVGMGVAFAGIIRVPMTSVIMIFEITRDYSIIVPLMIANLISYLISSRLQKKPIYEALMQQDGIHFPTAAREREISICVGQGMRVPDRIFRSTDTLGEALDHFPPQAAFWPVLRADGAPGMLSLAQLREAAHKVPRDRILQDFILPIQSTIDPDIGRIPHLHPDQPLDAALRQIARSGCDPLPVISRVKPDELIGVIGREDVLAAFKDDAGEAAAAQPAPGVKRSPAVAGGIVAVILLMTVLIGFLSYFYRSQRDARMEAFAQSGNHLMREGRYPEAVEQFRSALSVSHSSRDRLALATALLKARNWNEAAIYFGELARTQPDSGPANLGLARIAAQRGNVRDAARHYRKAIYGLWPQAEDAEGMRARMELAEFLAQHGQEVQARAELLALVGERPQDAELTLRAAQLLLDYGMPAESSQVFLEMVRKAPQRSDAHAGLGRARFALGEFAAARQALQAAVDLNPYDVQSRQRLELSKKIMAIDPTAARLRPEEKYARSRRLLEEVVRRLEACPGDDAQEPGMDAAHKAARKALERRARPASSATAAAANLNLAAQLWRGRGRRCAASEILDALMPRLAP